MPFTIDGNWIPSPTPKTPQKPVKVRLVKEGKNILTFILNLSLADNELDDLAKELKKSLGCGGTIIDGTVKLQGDKVDAVKKFLLKKGIKTV